MGAPRSFIVGDVSISGCELDSWTCKGGGIDILLLEYTWSGWALAEIEVGISVLGSISGWLLLGVARNDLGNTKEDSSCWGEVKFDEPDGRETDRYPYLL